MVSQVEITVRQRETIAVGARGRECSLCKARGGELDLLYKPQALAREQGSFLVKLDSGKPEIKGENKQI